MNRAPIGLLDSGFGGLSIYRSVAQLLPGESTVFIGDHAYLPYGGRTDADIRARVRKLIRFLLAKRAKLIVVACNTATVAGIGTYRSWFPDIPIVGVVPVIKTAAALTKKQSFAVLSTAFTSKSAYQKDLIRAFAPKATVYSIGCPNLLEFVESGRMDDPRVHDELAALLPEGMRRNIDAMVLGCTHYPFLIRQIRAIVGRNIPILDSGGAVARQVERILIHNKIVSGASEARHEFYSTSRDTDRSRIAGILLGKPTRVQYADI